MNRATTIARRELSSYFFSPIAYVAMAVFLLACGFTFWDDFQPGEIAGMRNLFNWMVWLLVFIIPLLVHGTARPGMGDRNHRNADDRAGRRNRCGAGKIPRLVRVFPGAAGPDAALCRRAGDLSPTPRIDFGPILSGYLGIILVGGLFISIGLFCSSLTRSQIVAAVATAAVLFAITIVPWWASGKTALAGFGPTVLNQTVFRRYTDFSKGIIDTGNLVFFVLVNGRVFVPHNQSSGITAMEMSSEMIRRSIQQRHDPGHSGIPEPALDEVRRQRRPLQRRRRSLLAGHAHVAGPIPRLRSTPPSAARKALRPQSVDFIKDINQPIRIVALYPKLKSESHEQDYLSAGRRSADRIHHQGP